MGEHSRLKRIRVVAAVLIESGRVLAARRGPEMRMPGLWEFPGGKVEAGETDQEALRRELQEELAVDVLVTDRVAAVVHRYEAFEIELIAYACSERRGELQPREHAELRWLENSGLRSVQWAAADVGLLDAVASVLAP